MNTFKHFLLGISLGFILIPIYAFAAGGQVVDVDIEGMSCKFCAYSVQKNLKKIPGVEQAEVNIETKKAHVVMAEGQQANIEQIKKKISEAGFTPVKVVIGKTN